MKMALNGHCFLTCQRYLTALAPFRLPSRRTIKTPNLLLNSKLGFCRGFSCSFMDHSAEPVHVKEKIELTDKEKQIFERLLDVVRHFNLQTQLRVAGGWVRDKLLGKECYDIDIALDNMLGREFCDKVNEYLTSNGEETQGIGVIQCNPDQSKHLETARMRLYNIWIDFVNLRSEDYSENSRIPTMKFGTAEQDAYRRDLTINSLFYNINTNSVEDFTGRGVADLKSGKIVTPLPPMDTFLDDPLRVIRAIRFGARFRFILDEDLKTAAASDKVKAAIADKISRERIGHEIDLMISGNEPVKAMAYICDLQLFWVVFSLPEESEPLKLKGCDRNCITSMSAAHDLLHAVGFLNFTDEQRRLYLYGALFLPLRQFVYTDNKNKKVPIVNHIFRSSLKLKASDAETVMKLHTSSEGFQPLISSILLNKIEHIKGDSECRGFHVSDASRQRIMAGKLLRDIKGFWRVSLLISILISSEGSCHSEAFQGASSKFDKSSQLYEHVEKAIVELGLDNVWEMKPLINGKEIMNILQLKQGGPQVKIWQERLLEWQLAHPSGTAEECVSWMKHELEQTQSKRQKLETLSNNQEQDLVEVKEN